jgi:probable HAF family extracellular repeat protein
MIGLYSDSAGLPHSFLRQPNGRFISLPTVHSTAGNEQFMPNAINILGQIIGNTVVGNPVSGFNSTAFVLPFSGGAPRDLGSLNGGSTFAVGINNLGQIVGSSVVLPETEMGFFITYPFLYSGGKMINIGPPVFSDMFSYTAAAINDSGTIVGTESVETTADFGFVYYKGHLYSNLTALVVPNPYPNHFVNQAIGINDFGVILAESQFLQNNNQITTHAVILTPIRHWNQ